MTEEWRKIEGYDKYEVSNLGQVRRGGRVLKPYVKPGNTTSYNLIYLCKDGVRIHKQVHRLVALAFLPNPENKTTVNHKDHDGLNNSVDNLEWATSQEQNLYSPPPIGKSGQRYIGLTNSNSYQVRITRNCSVVYNKTFPTLPEAVKARDNYTLLLDGRTG